MYVDAERRFQELEAETKKLHEESRKYFEAINGMLNHQILFSKAMTEIYKPISGRMSDPETLKIQGNPEGVRACEEYEIVVKELQETLQPELEMIESRVIRPADELLDVIKVIRKTALKREHKMVDYDRHRATLKKLQDKKERSAKDEKALWKAENDVEQATQDYNYFNDLLKEELPKLFALESEFIQPLFQSFYFMQLNIFYTLHEKMQNCDIGYFDLTLDIEDAFNAKRGDIQEQVEALSIVRFKSTGQRRPPKFNRPAAIESRPSPGLIAAGPQSAKPSTVPRITYPGDASDDEEAGGSHPPPPYSAPATPLSGAPASPNLAAILQKGKPLAAKTTSSFLTPSRAAALAPAPAAETVTALYAYSAQADGDLSFQAGDVIEIVSRTNNQNEWWTGRLGGQEGQFPGIWSPCLHCFTFA